MEQKIEQILSQTNYSQEEILKKLEENDGDAISVIREYMGIKKKSESNKIKSNQLNQEIYRQIRRTLDDSMKQYREQNPINISEASNNLRESEERKKLKNNNNPLK
jgi:hypothetical protein